MSCQCTDVLRPVACRWRMQGRAAGTGLVGTGGSRQEPSWGYPRVQLCCWASASVWLPTAGARLPLLVHPIACYAPRMGAHQWPCDIARRVMPCPLDGVPAEGYHAQVTFCCTCQVSAAGAAEEGGARARIRGRLQRPRAGVGGGGCAGAPFLLLGTGSRSGTCVAARHGLGRLH